jgi:hypothetical protein
MRLFLMLLSFMTPLFFVSCAGPVWAGRTASLPTVLDMDGNEVSLAGLLQNDPAKSEGVPDYLLLVNSDTTCDVSFKFVTDLSAAWEAFAALNCRGACVLYEKRGASVEAWKGFSRPGLSIYRDPEEVCLDFYAKRLVPALTVVDSTGTMRFHCEGYVEPEMLARKIENADFMEVKTKGG